MLVYVLNKHGNPLMPCKPAKARHLLRDKKAKVVNLEPFTIQLLYGSSGYKQPITVGLDPGYKNGGVSAISDKAEVYKAEIEFRTDIQKLLSERRAYRRPRRNRKTRYRQPRFDNRGKEGWYAPSVRHKIDSHIKIIDNIAKILPITGIVMELAQFDIQKLKNPDIEGEGYQNGEQKDFWNVREYVLYRDNHTCQHCKGKSKDKILEVHHIESRQTGGDRPENLITLCKTDHDAHHEEGMELNIKKSSKGFRLEAFTNIIKWQIYNRLKERYPTRATFGYLTKSARIEQNLDKTHYNDAYVIAGGNGHNRLDVLYRQKQVRKNNRKLYRGIRSHIRNTADRLLFGFQRFDKVFYNGIKCFIFGRRKSGYFEIRKLDGEKINSSVNHKKLRLLKNANTFLTDTEFLPALKSGVSFGCSLSNSLLDTQNYGSAIGK